MFLSAVQPYIVAIIIAVVVVQYAFALFCLLKLAYLDIDKKYYILWNVFILIVFFIGGGVFLVYYYKHPELKLSNAPQAEQSTEQTSEQTDQTEQTENADTPIADNAEDPQGEATGERSDNGTEETDKD